MISILFPSIPLQHRELKKTQDQRQHIFDIWRQTTMSSLSHIPTLFSDRWTRFCHGCKPLQTPRAEVSVLHVFHFPHASARRLRLCRGNLTFQYAAATELTSRYAIRSFEWRKTLSGESRWSRFPRSSVAQEVIAAGRLNIEQSQIWHCDASVVEFRAQVCHFCHCDTLWILWNVVQMNGKKSPSMWDSMFRRKGESSEIQRCLMKNDKMQKKKNEWDSADCFQTGLILLG